MPSIRTAVTTGLVLAAGEAGGLFGALSFVVVAGAPADER